jgi:hypothetical protein
LEKRVLLELYLLLLVSSSMKMAKMESRTFGRGFSDEITPLDLRNPLKAANPEATFLIVLRDLELMYLYYLALRK